MSNLVLHLAKGDVYFFGLLAAAAGPWLRLRYHGTFVRPLLVLASVLGALSVALSATPAPSWLLTLWFLFWIVSLVATETSFAISERVRPWGLTVLTVVSLVAAFVELYYQVIPRIPFPPDKPIVVIGDSLSAGTESRAQPWPVLLAETTDRSVTNLAVSGNTVRGALKEAQTVGDADVSVLLEIGGNDLLGRSPSATLESDLRKLLDIVCRPGRAVAMFELPLPPWSADYGRVQRRLARQYGVTLIPKKVLAGVMAAPDGTLDGLHLSQAGHERLAREISRALRQ